MSLSQPPMLHACACRCAEDALSRIDNPDPRSINAIVVKRRWIAGEATDEELAAAEADAWTAAQDASWDAQDAAEAAARNAQVDMLTQMLREYVGTGEEMG